MSTNQPTSPGDRPDAIADQIPEDDGSDSRVESTEGGVADPSTADIRERLNAQPGPDNLPDDLGGDDASGEDPDTDVAPDGSDGASEPTD